MPSFGLWSKVFLDYVGLRKALRAVIRMRAGQVGAWQRSPSLPLQCRQCSSRGRDWVSAMEMEWKWGVGFCDNVWRVVPE
jgi:hypothetical protein